MINIGLSSDFFLKVGPGDHLGEALADGQKLLMFGGLSLNKTSHQLN